MIGPTANVYPGLIDGQEFSRGRALHLWLSARCARQDEKFVLVRWNTWPIFDRVFICGMASELSGGLASKADQLRALILDSLAKLLA